MKLSTGLMALLVGIVWGGIVFIGAAGPARAADVEVLRPGARSATVATPRGPALPFPRSERSQSVWASDSCWGGCQSYCSWAQAACIHYDEQGNCLLATDHCDRACQRGCRGWGGPLVPDIFDF